MNEIFILGHYIKDNNKDIKLADIASHSTYLKGAKEFDVIAFPTVYLLKDSKCYFFSWSLDNTLENYK